MYKNYMKLFFKAWAVSLIVGVVSLFYTLNWPIYDLGKSQYAYIGATVLFIHVILAMFSKIHGNERGYVRAMRTEKTKIGGLFWTALAPIAVPFIYGFMLTTLDHWQLRLFANEPEQKIVKIKELQNNKFNWYTWKTRVQNIDSLEWRTLYLSKDFVNHYDIGKCMVLKGERNYYGMYIREKEYISCN